MGSALHNAFSQIFEPNTSHVVRQTIFVSLSALIVVTGIALFPLFTTLPFVADRFNWIFGLAAMMSFPALVTAIMAKKLDFVSQSVEEQFYKKDKSLYSEYRSASLFKFMLTTLLINMFIPIIFNVFTLDFLDILFLIIANSFLIGREYFRMAALRHLSKKETEDMMTSNRLRIFLFGFVIIFIFGIPILCVVAPVVGMSLMTHLFHFIEEKSAS